MTTSTGPRATDLLLDQLDWHWQHQLRPRLDGLTDDEYSWEPVPGSWSIRPRGTGAAPVQAGRGGFVIDFAFPPPDPPPVTTIAWRLGHAVVGVLGARVACATERDAELEEELKKLLYRQVDLHRETIEHNRMRTLATLRVMEANIKLLEDKRDEMVERRFRTLTVGKKPAPPPKEQ